jgi:hypothetical protein
MLKNNRTKLIIVGGKLLLMNHEKGEGVGTSVCSKKGKAL